MPYYEDHLLPLRKNGSCAPRLSAERLSPLLTKTAEAVRRIPPHPRSCPDAAHAIDRTTSASRVAPVHRIVSVPVRHPLRATPRHATPNRALSLRFPSGKHGAARLVAPS
uniref:Uncharacterized protein n=1 Tax=Oryza rufipogon TaxID=4529 RepID=A0A0E0QKY1_ORYRU